MGVKFVSTVKGFGMNTVVNVVLISAYIVGIAGFVILLIHTGDTFVRRRKRRRNFGSNNDRYIHLHSQSDDRLQ